MAPFQFLITPTVNILARSPGAGPVITTRFPHGMAFWARSYPTVIGGAVGASSPVYAGTGINLSAHVLATTGQPVEVPFVATTVADANWTAAIPDQKRVAFADNGIFAATYGAGLATAWQVLNTSAAQIYTPRATLVEMCAMLNNELGGRARRHLTSVTYQCAAAPASDGGAYELNTICTYRFRVALSTVEVQRHPSAFMALDRQGSEFYMYLPAGDALANPAQAVRVKVRVTTELSTGVEAAGSAIQPAGADGETSILTILGLSASFGPGEDRSNYSSVPNIIREVNIGRGTYSAAAVSQEFQRTTSSLWLPTTFSYSLKPCQCIQSRIQDSRR